MPKQNDGSWYTGIYDSTQRVERNEFPANHRAVGVMVSEPFAHRGLGGSYVEIAMETVRYVDTIQFGQSIPVGEWRERVRQDTETIIADLDAVMAELAAHRTRMVKQLADLSQGDVSSADKTPPASEPATDLKDYRVHQVHTVEFVIRAPSGEDAKAHAHAQVAAMTDGGEFADIDTPLAPNVTLVDFDATLDERDVTVEENEATQETVA